MKLRKTLILGIFCNLLGFDRPQAAEPGLSYLDNKKLSREIRELASRNDSAARVRSLARTSQGNELWLAELGRGTDQERAKRPAILLMAGIEGDELAGTTVLLHWAGELLRSSKPGGATSNLLDSTTIYLLPRANPDAASAFFKKPLQSSTHNLRPVDDDHDGLADEDGPEDLNGDGFITQMRVQDPDGEYMLDPVDPAFLVKADRTKGEVGAWKLHTEGRDNDGDREWNEDGPGGVNFNRNFPQFYKFFDAASGPHPVSEPEIRALADFIIGHPNIGLVFVFSPADQLGQTPKGEAAKRPPVGIVDSDIPYFRELGKSWRDAMGLKKEKELGPKSLPGSFSEWVYFQRGRLAISTPVWSAALQLELQKQAASSEKAGPEEKPAEPKKSAPAGESGKPSEDSRNEEDRAFARWLASASTNAFLPWQPFDHPDFPGQRVEIGGFKPFVRRQPPESSLPGLAEQHGRFLNTLASRLPRIGLRKVDVRHLGRSIYEITAQVENTGYLPTILNHGETSQAVLPTRARLDLDPKSILSGTKTTILASIPGSGGMVEVRWVVHAREKKSIRLEVVSALAGSFSREINLPAGGAR